MIKIFPNYNTYPIIVRTSSNLNCLSPITACTSCNLIDLGSITVHNSCNLNWLCSLNVRTTCNLSCMCPTCNLNCLGFITVRTSCNLKCMWPITARTNGKLNCQSPLIVCTSCTLNCMCLIIVRTTITGFKIFRVKSLNDRNLEFAHYYSVFHVLNLNIVWLLGQFINYQNRNNTSYTCIHNEITVFMKCSREFRDIMYVDITKKPFFLCSTTENTSKSILNVSY